MYMVPLTMGRVNVMENSQRVGLMLNEAFYI